LRESAEEKEIVNTMRKEEKEKWERGKDKENIKKIVRKEEGRKGGA
jgi:hypothetical protein